MKNKGLTIIEILIIIAAILIMISIFVPKAKAQTTTTTSTSTTTTTLLPWPLNGNPCLMDISKVPEQYRTIVNQLKQAKGCQ